MIEVHAVAVHLMNTSAKFETNRPSRSVGIVGTSLKNTVSRKTRLKFEIQKIRLKSKKKWRKIILSSIPMPAPYNIPCFLVEFVFT